MFLVGLTGGIATGKSSVAHFMRHLGVEIIDADLVAREVVEPGKRAWKRIRREFGAAVFHSDGTLNREALGQIIFSEPKKREVLNSITHPEIYKSILFQYFRLLFYGHQFAVVDLPLLYESGKMVKYLNKTIVVVCDPTQQLERLMKRNNLTESNAMDRINAQVSLTEKAKLADFVITNNADPVSIEEQVVSIVQELQRSKAHWKYRCVAISTIALTVTVLAVGPYMVYAHLWDRS